MLQLGLIFHSQQENRCRPRLLDTDFESVGWGGEVMELGTLRLQSLQVFLCYVMNKLISAHFFHVQLGIVEQTIIDS